MFRGKARDNNSHEVWKERNRNAATRQGHSRRRHNDDFTLSVNRRNESSEGREQAKKRREKSCGYGPDGIPIARVTLRKKRETGDSRLSSLASSTRRATSHLIQCLSIPTFFSRLGTTRRTNQPTNLPRLWSHTFSLFPFPELFCSR